MAERISGGRDGPFPASATALLLVDMQRIWLEPGRNPRHPEWGASHYFYREASTRAVPNQCLIVEAARASGVEIIHTIIRSMTRNGRDRSLDHQLTPIHVSPDDPHGRPVPELAPARPE